MTNLERKYVLKFTGELNPGYLFIYKDGSSTHVEKGAATQLTLPEAFGLKNMFTFMMMFGGHKSAYLIEEIE